jgi:hypothetical protein
MNAVVVSNRDTTRAAAEQLLAALGDTPAKIARTLYDAGIRGERCHGSACPIATYLLRSDLGLYDVALMGNIAALYFGDGSNCICVDIPDAVAEFIDRFDTGAHDELLAGAR